MRSLLTRCIHRFHVRGGQAITETTAAATVGVVAQIDKIALHLAYERGPQKVSVPVSISNELSATSLGLTLAATAAVCALIKYCYLDPRQVRCSQVSGKLTADTLSRITTFQEGDGLIEAVS